MNSPKIIQTIGLTPEQSALVTSGKVRITLHSSDAKKPAPTVRPVAPKAAPAVKAADVSAVAVVAASVPPGKPDYASMSSEKLWSIHATITDSKERTRFYRAYLSPSVRAHLI